MGKAWKVFVDLLDQYGRGKDLLELILLCSGSGGAVVAMALAMFDGAPWWAVSLATIIGFLCIPLVFIAWTIYRRIKSEVLEIVFDSKDASYPYVEFGPTTRKGIHEGKWQTHRIKICNKSDSAIHDLQVQLTDILPRPPQMSGKLPLFLKFKDYSRQETKASLGPKQEILVDVASYRDSWDNPHLVIEEAGHGVKNPVEVYAPTKDDPAPFYTVTIKPTAINGTGELKRFKLWRQNMNLQLVEIP